jgi:carbamoyltransferase
MIVLGLHFGHDSSLCVLRDGQVLTALVKERKNRVRHAIGIDRSDVEDVLTRVGLCAAQVDLCSISSTQDIEYLFFDPARLSFEIGGDCAQEVPSPFYAPLAARQDPAAGLPGRRRLAEVLAPGQDHHYRLLFRQYADREIATLASVPSIEDFAFAPEWHRAQSFAEMRRTDYRRLINPHFARSFHLPVTVRLDGRRVPGALFSHHYAHAAYAFYSSSFDSAAVLSHDGGSTRRGYRAGMFYWGNQEMLYPLTPHYLSAGWTYYEIAKTIGLGAIGGEGKLMGLAGYGQPAFPFSDFVGNWHDGPFAGEAKHPDRWFTHLRNAAETAGYDLRPLGDPARMTERVNADMAATTQRWFEETMLSAVDTLALALARSGIAETNLCLSGGAALNCPTNSRIAAESRFSAVSVPAACDDSGLAIGSALALYHGILGHKRDLSLIRHPWQACLGGTYDISEIRRAAARFGDRIILAEPPDVADAAAALLEQNAIIGWFQGHSEIGPRALGQRSILANPRAGDTWGRVNRVKGREAWRPFAPAVLDTHAASWFHGIPLPSHYMLFTAEVTSNDIPAVTHADRTARIQTVSPDNGRFHDLLAAFHRRSGMPVLLNTSFNGPGEPIVETPDDALRFFAGSALDALFIGDLQVTHCP